MMMMEEEEDYSTWWKRVWTFDPKASGRCWLFLSELLQWCHHHHHHDLLFLYSWSHPVSLKGLAHLFLLLWMDSSHLRRARRGGAVPTSSKGSGGRSGWNATGRCQPFACLSAPIYRTTWTLNKFRRWTEVSAVWHFTLTLFVPHMGNNIFVSTLLRNHG